MHEMGIASSVLEAVEKEVHRYPGHRAARVGLRIGPFAAVDCDSLRFCFEALVKDSDFQPLDLSIELSHGDELDIAFIELDEVRTSSQRLPLQPEAVSPLSPLVGTSEDSPSQPFLEAAAPFAPAPGSEVSSRSSGFVDPPAPLPGLRTPGTTAVAASTDCSTG